MMQFANTLETERSKFGRWLVLLAVVVSLSLLTACGSSDDSWQRIQEEGVLRVGLDPTFPPFETTTGDSVQGFDIDLAEAIADQLGVSVAYSHFGYDGLYDALQTGQVDLLISALAIVPERMEDFAYSRPYYDAGQFLIVAPDSNIGGMEDLDGRRLAVELGAMGHVEALSWMQSQPDMQIEEHNTAAEAVAAVADSSADAALVDSVSGRLFLKESGPTATLEMLPEPILTEPFAIVLRIEDQELLEQIDGTLAEISGSGRLNEITRRWLGP